MAHEYEIEIQAQPSIYGSKNRSINLFFAEPENGANKDTGIMLILAGYGGNANSKVYAKMRTLFADQYNLFTVQCNYFGYKYMQNRSVKNISEGMLLNTLSNAELDLLRRDYDKYSHILNGKIFYENIELDEKQNDFNDMGLMQAIDNLRAMKVVLDIISDNGYKINKNRVYAYGFSHGAYIAYLCNAFWPSLFTGIIDNSSYIEPYYLDHIRGSLVVVDGITIEQIYSYKAIEYIKDNEILYLPNIYKQFINKARIICFAGDDDYMTSIDDKKAFLSMVENSTVDVITKARVEMKCFKSNKHGLGADFIELFRYAYEKYFMQKQDLKKNVIEYKNMAFDSSKFHYEIYWEEGIPILKREEK